MLCFCGHGAGKQYVYIGKGEMDSISRLRHWKRWQQWQFPLLRCADPALPVEVRARTAERFEDSCHFCLAEFCDAYAKVAVVKPKQEIVYEDWQTAFFEMADQMNCQSDIVERKAGHKEEIFSRHVQGDYQPPPLSADRLLEKLQDDLPRSPFENKKWGDALEIPVTSPEGCIMLTMSFRREV